MRKAVVALGGNAISPIDQVDSIPHQFSQTRKSLNAIIELIKNDIIPVISHGNGPQVGNAALRTELTPDLPYLPLGINVADTEGGMGYMIEQSLLNRMKQENIHKRVVTLVTQVIVDQNDPSVLNPEKYVGQALSKEIAFEKKAKFNWTIKELPNGKWRRVVPSPQPIDVVNSEIIKLLVEAGHIVIAGGGGGIPTYYDENGLLEGMDAVIDKDKASALIGNQIEAELLYILTGVAKVQLDFGKPNARFLDRMTVSEAEQYLKEGQFPPGNMGPKIQASIQFLKNGGQKVIITDIDSISSGFSEDLGTIIVND
jgi:carbamate kinase